MKQVIKTINSYVIEITHGFSLESLKDQWLTIQANQDLPFFLTWSWISCWIKTYDPEVVLVKAFFESNPVAIGLLTCSEDNRHVFIKSRQYRLHQMGDPLLDQIWIEYNDFICKSGHDEKAVIACIKAIQTSIPDWDEIILSMTTEHRYKSFTDNAIQSTVTLKVPCYSVNLKSLRLDNLSYLDTLNSNTRYQIRRSIREYEKNSGQLSLCFAKSKEQAVQFFHEAGSMHRDRWSDSGFNNIEFTRFHEQLILDNYDHESIELIKVTTASSTIAIMYNLILDKRVYFYLQGVKYDENKKYKPGLVSHSLITQYYLDKGMELYDYMGGYSQYKTQLASHTSDCYSICIQKPKIKFALENIGKSLKHVINKQN